MDGLIALALAKKYSDSHGGMPDPSGFKDGTALVKVGDEWKPQSGYGWSEELERVIIPEYAQEGVVYFRVADAPELPAGFGIGSDVTVWVLFGEEEVKMSSQIDYASNGAYSTVEEGGFFCIATEDGAVLALDDDINATFPHKGMYFWYTDGGDATMYSTGFAFGEDASEKLISWDGNIGSVHQFDPKYIPGSSDTDFVIHFTSHAGADNTTVTADKTVPEFLQAIDNGKHIVGTLVNDGGDILGDLQYAYNHFRVILVNGGYLQSIMIQPAGLTGWDYDMENYDLSSYASRAEVDAKIATAIGNAIGGEY